MTHEYQLEFFAWLSTSGEKKYKSVNNVVFAGLVRDVPQQLKFLVTENKLNSKYCIITKNESGKIIRPY